ncbi:MAG: hypothetical protein H8K06_07695 [Nitrospira sp.]|uniref:Uncharacterized protein n=1 Tax=Nitrospira defluvii TaxID=330214 RepID=A0ABM8RLG8_9BACT|nr:hypothetical protein [Nitrospira defluvii]MCS6326952.1 hypothetical protein [Nitrospira sp.]CAE6759714.1 exported hypothetical protein [Nitrospira defluvii]
MVRSNQYCSPRPALFLLELVCAFMLLSCMAPHPVFAQTEEEQSRACWGFLYCKETKGDTTWTEGFLWLYSTEERGTFSRLTLVPFYSREADSATDYSRRSVLWPLGISERRGDTSYFQILPFYWQAHDPQQQYRIVAPLFFDYATGDSRYTHYLPLFGHHQHGSLYHRYYLLGPLAIATYDKETDLKEWDILFPLFHYGADRKGYEARFFPLYWSGSTYDDGNWYRHLFPLYWSGGKEADGSWYRHILPLHGRSVTPQSDLSYVFPLYGSVTDAESHETRTSLVGLPPFPRTSLPALALYEHASSPASVSDRFFPLYRYTYAEPEQRRELNVLALYQMQNSPALTFHRLFPLYSYEDDREKNRGGWSFLGYDRFSLTGHGHDSAQQWHQVLPLYRTLQDVTAHTRTTDVLGLGPLSFFRHSQNPDGSFHRFFPLYSYEHPSEDEWHWSALIATPLALYRHDEKGTAIHDRFFPLYDWDRNGDWREFSVLGISWFSIFYRESGPTLFTHRLFPVYRYRHDLASDEVDMDTLLLHRHHSTATQGTDRFFLLWDSTWQREQPIWELDFLGIKPVTLFHHATSPTDTTDRLFPLYGYERTAADEQRLSLLGFPPREKEFSWSLYDQSTSSAHFRTRFFPLYRYERNDETKEVNWSALLLYRHAESESHLRDTFLPLHEYERDGAKGTAEFSLIGLKPVTLFKQGSAPDAANSMLFPLYDYDREGDTNRLSLLGWPKVGTFPTLSLFERVATPSETTHRFFPLYRYNRNDEAKTVNWDALLWWHRETEYWKQDVLYPFMDIEHDRQKDLHEVGLLGMRPLTFFQYRSSSTEYWHYAALLYKYSLEGDHQRFSALGLPHFGQFPALSLFAMERTSTTYTQRFFPLYAYAKDDQTGTVEQRFSALGLPHLGKFPALSLIAMEQTETTRSHRFLPLYWYARDEQTGTLDWQALLLWWHQTDPTQTRDTFFPLGSLRRTMNEQTWNFSALGVEPVSLIQIGKSDTGTRNRFSPLWDYGEEGQDWRLSFVGIRQASLFSHDRTATSTTSHLFPLWWRNDSPTEAMNLFVPLWSDITDHQTHQQARGILGLGPLSLYYQERTPSGVTARLFPLWGYQHDEATQEHRTSALGVYPISLYYGYRSPTATENRLFPFFRYTSDLVKNESAFWFLWPLYDQKTAEGRTTEASFLWWLFEYRSPKADEWEYWVLGHPPMAMFIRTVSPTTTHVEINPIIPLWRRDSVEGVGTSWAVLGGLIGMDAMPDGTHKLRLLWMSNKD